MSLSTLLNRGRMTVASAPGTGTITLGSAAPGFQSFASAGALNGQLISYILEDGSNWELGQGPYSTTGPTLTRTTITASSNSGSAISATANALVSATALAADLNAWIQSPNDNRIINGDMRIDQRNNGASGAASSLYTIDRWGFYTSQINKFTWARNLYSLAGPSGFPYYFGFVSSGAFSPAAADYFFLTQPIEADFIGDFAWGSASAQPVTLSFWVMASAAGTYSGSLINGASTRTYPFSFPVTTTWTKVVLTIPGDTTGTWVLSGNGAGMNVRFDLGSGSNIRGPAGSWSGTNYVGVTGTVNLLSATSQTFYITGVKLEIGSIATPFNRQSLARSLADCQRYYRRLGGTNIGVLVSNYAPAGGLGTYATLAFPEMRVSPTAILVGTWTLVNVGTPSIAGFSPSTVVIGAVSTAAGVTQFITTGATTYIDLSAEL